MKFCQRFNEILSVTDKTQTQIANAVGVTKLVISDYKHGKSVPSLDTLYALCKYLDVSADYMLGLSDVI